MRLMFLWLHWPLTSCFGVERFTLVRWALVGNENLLIFKAFEMMLRQYFNSNSLLLCNSCKTTNYSDQEQLCNSRSRRTSLWKPTFYDLNDITCRGWRDDIVEQRNALKANTGQWPLFGAQKTSLMITENSSCARQW